MSIPRLISFIVLILYAPSLSAANNCACTKPMAGCTDLLCFTHFTSDTLPKIKVDMRQKADTTLQQLKAVTDSTKKEVRDQLNEQLKEKKAVIQSVFSTKKITNITDSLPGRLKASIIQVKPSLPKPRGGLNLQSGMLAYNFNYRSILDTPFAERNVAQHIISGQVNMLAWNMPLKANFLLRRSSSPYFADINNIQVEFDAQRYRQQMKAGLNNQLLAMGKQLKDSLLEIDYRLKLKEFTLAEKAINEPMRFQQFIESKEILNLPEENIGQADSAEQARLREMKLAARKFIQFYEQQEKNFAVVKAKKDSSEAKYKLMQEKIRRWQDFVKNKAGEKRSIGSLHDAAKEFGINTDKLPKHYQFLSNIRRAGIGRNQLNYSELTSKNISTTGLNIEYNSWYYFSLTAGTIDFRFRDFAVSKFKRTPQFMYMVRVGVGRIEKNYFIVSAYQGKKQLFVSANTNGGVQSIPVKGLAAEAKWRLHPSTYLKAEIAQSLSQDFRKNPAQNMKLGLKDQSNLAYLAKVSSYFPKTRSRLEASYRYTGGNFQSFSSFQTNASMRAWYVKADQSFFKRQLYVSASVKANDFYNDFIAQRFESNTVFKSIQASVRVKGLPFITAGYVPVSQLTYVDSVLTENHFQSLNTSIIHSYKIGNWNANMSAVYTRFYNRPADTTITYYNAENIFISNSVDMNVYTFKLTVSSSSSRQFKLLVMDAGFDLRIAKKGTIGFGAKGNNFNKKTGGTGLYVRSEYDLKNIGKISLQYEKGYLPGNNYRFMRNDIMNVNFSKTFINRSR